MSAADDLHKEWQAEIELAKFSLIAAQLLCEELDKDMSVADRLSYKKRHKKHLQGMYFHLRKAKRISRTIRRIEKRGSRDGR